MAAIITNKLRIYNAQQFIESLNESASQWEPGSPYVLGDIVFNNTNLYICVEAGTSSADPSWMGPEHETGVSADGTAKWLYYNKSAYNNLYLGIGKTDPWGTENDVPAGSGGGTETNPPTPLDTISNQYNILNNLIAIKKIDPKFVTLALPRINWEAGQVYTMYEHDSGEEIIPNNYVMTEDNNQYNVYKCINNKAYFDGAYQEVISTVKPTGTDPDDILTTGDGYRWKFMYSILLDEAMKFLTEDYMPVKHLATDPNGGDPALNNPGHLQWQVQQSAKEGAIEHISVVDMGSGYEPNNAGMVQSATSNTVVLDSNAAVSPVSGIYDGYAVYITSGTGEGQMRVIDNYYGNDGFSGGYPDFTATIVGTWDVQPDGTSQYRVGPWINPNDSDPLTTGTGLKAIANVSGGFITSVDVIDGGTGYNSINATVSAPNGGNALQATVKGIISPPNGHGYNPVEELGGYYGMIDMKLVYDENHMLPVVGDASHFRQISVIVDPIEEQSGVSCNASIYRAVQHPEYTTYTSQDTAAAFDVQVGDETPASERTVAGTGKLLYVENRQQISRAIDQIEDIKIVFEF